jgi:dinuclear metal center YbgI/SA1388 family protein
MKLQDLLVHLRNIAPLDLAADWDNVGLLLGDADSDVRRVLTCLTVTPEVVAEATDKRADLIVTHHPILFRPTKNLTTATAEGRMLLTLARFNVAVYSAHTAFDNASAGMNERIATRLQLTDVLPLRRRTLQQYKVVVITPDKDLARVSDALFAAGAGTIGHYNECSFRVAGTGTFFGTEQANPTVGQKGRREDVSEWRLEVICPAERLEAVIAELRRAHSYEEPAYDVYPLRPAGASLGGEGRLGRLPRPMPLVELARSVRTLLGAAGMQFVGDPAKSVQSVAIVCGAAASMLPEVMAAGADVFITGELRFHDCLAAQQQQLALLLPGHYASERFGMEELARELQALLPELQVWASQRECDPVQWLLDPLLS